MTSPTANVSENNPGRDQHTSVVVFYRENDLFQKLLPQIEAELDFHGIHIRRVAFPATAIPIDMQPKLSEFTSQLDSHCVVVTDLSSRRGMQSLKDEGIPLLNAAGSGILLDRALAATVKKIIYSELRLPLQSLVSPQVSPEELKGRGEAFLKAERVFFEFLLGPIVFTHPQHQFIIAAPMLFSHLPFISYVGALQSCYIAHKGGPNAVITGGLVDEGGKGNLLHHCQIPLDVRQELAKVATDEVIDPSDWIQNILLTFGCVREQIHIIRSASELVEAVSNEDRHLSVVLGDRHLLNDKVLTKKLVETGMPEELAKYQGAHCLAGPTFRLPLESLIADIADAGLLSYLNLLHGVQVRNELALAISNEIRTAHERRKAV